MKNTRIKKTLLILTLITSAPAIFGNDAFDEVSRQLQQKPIKEGRFLQKKHLPFLSQPLVSSGSFTNDNINGITWQVKKPITSTLTISNAGIFIDGSPVQNNSFTVLIQSIFFSLLNGNSKIIGDNFVIQEKVLTKNTKEVDTTRWDFILTPRSKAFHQAIKSIEIFGQSHIEEIQLIEESSAVTTIVFSDIKIHRQTNSTHSEP